MNFSTITSKKAMRIDWKTLLKTKEKPANQETLPLEFTFNKNIPIFKNVIDKHRHSLYWEKLKNLLIKNRSLPKEK